MSYILEALRKAESERERGLVPGLNAQPLGPTDGGQVSAPGRLRTWAPWLIAAVAVLIAGVLAWAWRADTADQRVAVAEVPTQVPAPSPEVVAPTASPARPVYAPAPLPALPAVPRQQAPALAKSPSPVASRVTATASPLPAPGAATTSAPAEQRVVTLADLPEATRRELPSLSVAGASYSDHPANRLLIVNGNVFHEGDKLAADLVLERIDLKSAVLNFRGVRFGITY